MNLYVIHQDKIRWKLQSRKDDYVGWVVCIHAEQRNRHCTGSPMKEVIEVVLASPAGYGLEIAY